ncbi:MAG: hypothetical protein MI749_19280 [Desulfovibrionales bacterium]|nr:hypothetical protein [Desulfovibrionales bacterium]
MHNTNQFQLHSSPQNFGGTQWGGQSQYQGVNPNQYSYTSQYQGNYPQHSEALSSRSGQHVGGLGWAGTRSQYTGQSGLGYGGQSQYHGMAHGNQYGYTSQYQGNYPQHSEELSTRAHQNVGGFGMGTTRSQYTGGQTGYTGVSQYNPQVMSQANSYGYTGHYLGHSPNHPDELTNRTYTGGIGISSANLHGGYTGIGQGVNLSTGSNIRSQYGRQAQHQGIAQGNQYGYTSQYQGNYPQHSEELSSRTSQTGGFSNIGLGGGNYGSTMYTGSQFGGQGVSNQYGYTSQYRGQNIHHGEGGRNY